MTITTMKILIFGKGYLANRCKEIWGEDAVITPVKVFTTEDAVQAIQKHSPDVVFNAAGITGKPNVDWCEDHPIENMRGNTIMPLLLAEACAREDVYLLHLGSGCVFYDTSQHDDGVWREGDFANPTATYTRAKYAADLVLTTMPNVGVARIRMPIDNIPAPGNLIDKLARYPKLIDVENSVTIIEDMAKACYQLLEKKAEGMFHVVNPGVMKHKELIALYEQYVDPNHTNEWISAKELVDMGLATKKRSNNIMDQSHLLAVGVQMREVHEALEQTMKEYAENKKVGKVDPEGPTVC